MPSHVALIRGINVGGNKLLAMSDLKSLAERAGLRDCKTLLQSGNMVFTSNLRPAALEKQLESAIAKKCKLEVDVMVRSKSDWKRVVAGNPYPKHAADDPSHLLVVFFKSRIDESRVDALRSTIRGNEMVSAPGKELYCFYPDGIGTSKLTGAVVEKTLAARGTARNWNTVLKLATLLEA